MNRPGMGSARVRTIAIAARITADTAPTTQPNQVAASSGVRSPVSTYRIPKYAPRNGPKGASSAWAMGMMVHTSITASAVRTPLAMAGLPVGG